MADLVWEMYFTEFSTQQRHSENSTALLPLLFVATAENREVDDNLPWLAGAKASVSYPTSKVDSKAILKDNFMIAAVLFVFSLFILLFPLLVVLNDAMINRLLYPSFPEMTRFDDVTE